MAFIATGGKPKCCVTVSVLLPYFIWKHRYKNFIGKNNDCRKKSFKLNVRSFFSRLVDSSLVIALVCWMAFLTNCQVYLPHSYLDFIHLDFDISMDFSLKPIWILLQIFNLNFHSLICVKYNITVEICCFCECLQYMWIK